MWSRWTERLERKSWRVEVENSKQCGCNITAAPLVVKDLVITGVTGGDSAHRGYINAFDARTGRHRWRFWTIPGPGEPGHDTWAGDSWVYGGGSTWVTGTYDPELDLLYWAVGNPAADFYGGDREGDNLYTDSVVALDPDTGEIQWHYQQIPHDVWDYDTAYEMVLLDLEVDGVMRKTMLNPSKSGYVWLLDRQSGEFLGAWPLVESSNWIEGIDEQGRLIGRNEPPVGETSFVCPAIGGGRSWNHGAYSPQTGWFYSTGLEWCQTLTVRQEDPQEGLAFFGGEFEMAHPKSGKAHAHLSAYDPVTGERKWRIRHKYPLLASQLATAGGLVFSGDATGRFFALDAGDGSELWSFRTGSGPSRLRHHLRGGRPAVHRHSERLGLGSSRAHDTALAGGRELPFRLKHFRLRSAVTSGSAPRARAMLTITQITEQWSFVTHTCDPRRSRRRVNFAPFPKVMEDG